MQYNNMHKKGNIQKINHMAKGYFSQISNCEPKPFIFNLASIFNIKTC